ncbi:hypothetical protein HU200_026047 [Digitaria exilis]|uniref:Serine aminopeptidase S33 domain-containing protein n=1 Tax=Digitaria exilis TaxID=1010633 RepID=A0A835BZZ8_9POAL|nr:hypothetical protein HU200_026047 [Digitaria exilis]
MDQEAEDIKYEEELQQSAAYRCEKPENRGKKRFLYGISMGGSVALLLHRKAPDYWDGAILLAPMCKVKLPFLVLHGGDDIVTDPSVSKLLFEKASSRDKTFKLYPGMWHALTAELPDDVERVYSDIINWLDERANSSASVSKMSSTSNF